MTWTRFMDMHSGGGRKEKWDKILIEAPEEEARVIFYNRFGHSSERVSCTCCGEDYSVSSDASLAQLTAYDRGCRHLESPTRKGGGYVDTSTDPKFKEFREHYYLEEGENPPKGFKVDERDAHDRGEYKTLARYLKQKDVLVIRATEIKPGERKGEVPEQGYVWQD